MLEHLTDIEGDWNVIHYSKDPHCINHKIIIKGHGLDPNVFKIHVHIINEFTCVLKHNPDTNKWEVSEFTSTALHVLSKEDSHIEDVFKRLIMSIENVEIHDEQKLTFYRNNGERIELERLP